MRLVCGRGIANGMVECKPRDGAASEVPLAEAAALVAKRVGAALKRPLKAATA